MSKGLPAAIEAAKKQAATPENVASGKTELIFDSITGQVLLTDEANKANLLKNAHVEKDGRYCEVDEINAHFVTEKDGKSVDVISLISEKDKADEKIKAQAAELKRLRAQLKAKEEIAEPKEATEPAEPKQKVKKENK